MINEKDQRGAHAIHLAKMNGNFDIVELLENDSNVNVCDFDFNATDEKGETWLHQACFEGNSKAVKVMLEMSRDGYININAANKNNQYAFDLAKQNNHIEVLRLMYKHCETLNIDISGPSLGFWF